ncbi:hypothetical protein [Lacipirellula sp.]|uniref:hypothetical protein n=1 Tax=Lacipirellula sp. TaxID=2691419 RepID=UPI003D146EA2
MIQNKEELIAQALNILKSEKGSTINSIAHRIVKPDGQPVPAMTLYRWLAGKDKPKTPQRKSNIDIDICISKGLTDAATAEVTGYSVRTVQKYASPEAKTARRQVRARHKAFVLRLSRNGMTAPQIRNEIDLPITTIRNWIHQAKSA